MSDNSDPLGKPAEHTISWEYFDFGTITSSAPLDTVGLEDSTSIEPRDIPTEFSLLLGASGSLLDTEDTNFFLGPYVDHTATFLSSHDALRLSSESTDEPISHGEPTYETFGTLSSLPQTEDLETVFVDPRFDGQTSDILGLSQDIGIPLGTTFQSHFPPDIYRIPITELDGYSLSTMDLSPNYDGNSRTGFDRHIPHNRNGIPRINGQSTTGFNDLSFDVLQPMPANNRPLRRSPSDKLLGSRLWNCFVCGMRFNTYGQLITHASIQIHATLKCHVQPCGYVFVRKDQNYRRHLKTSHSKVYECQQCHVSFASQPLLEDHARRSGHACFVCDNQACDNTFSRLDTYQKHQNTHRDDAKRFSCPHCKKYRGLNGFKRKDHLTQHLRGYHHIGEDNAKSQGEYSCPHEDCLDYRNESGNGKHSKNHAFNKGSRYIKHMKTVHNESEFPCPYPACDRVGGKGYFRRADLRAHMKKIHGNDLTVIGATNV